MAVGIDAGWGGGHAAVDDTEQELGTATGAEAEGGGGVAATVANYCPQ